MGIPENQLITWAKQGVVKQSANTYKTIRDVIESSNAPYANQCPSSFLQGSYGNHTNIYGIESDVDVVLQCNSIHYQDLGNLSKPERELYRRAYSNAQYDYIDFKREAIYWLSQQFRGNVNPGTKAIRIKSQDNRREADVLPCVQFRRYLEFENYQNEKYVEGLCFFLPDGTRVTNYPKLHKYYCALKHQKTGNRFKFMVRILKNMRNRMRDDGLIGNGLAPSYYLEGLLYNVPNNLFEESYQRTFLKCYSYLQNTNITKLMCPNQQVKLLHLGRHTEQHTSWNRDNFIMFFRALAHFWRGWG